MLDFFGAFRMSGLRGWIKAFWDLEGCAGSLRDLVRGRGRDGVVEEGGTWRVAFCKRCLPFMFAVRECHRRGM